MKGRELFVSKDIIRTVTEEGTIMYLLHSMFTTTQKHQYSWSSFIEQFNNSPDNYQLNLSRLKCKPGSVHITTRFFCPNPLPWDELSQKGSCLTKNNSKNTSKENNNFYALNPKFRSLWDLLSCPHESTLQSYSSIMLEIAHYKKTVIENFHLWKKVIF